ncbi:MAG: hypothetical protein COT80_03365 [Candidatus Buchananbacteria bacterium CG10_big_fil_rev_8_21_14_0_10_33_19]|uniref:Uncharacterized protein n=1 Tax=Candidatus Buchananbacteria bacterium CG10_big_fil_rev_8_21_14_0_10_33_19 TaxID=1974525 RepID=A0A2H0W5A7_9BACT|nr:MAG: hypothetical protein COT80_03365 [Candidatus Buchananbacteria bacterium CG10_big_fil_rev_8_21_14_0_10_33_19]
MGDSGFNFGFDIGQRSLANPLGNIASGDVETECFATKGIPNFLWPVGNLEIEGEELVELVLPVIQPIGPLVATETFHGLSPCMLQSHW